MKPKSIAAGKFKAQCLQLMDEVEATRQPITITKHRRPVARLVPMEREAEFGFDRLRGAIRIIGDVVAPATPAEDWANPD